MAIRHARTTPTRLVPQGLTPFLQSPLVLNGTIALASAFLLLVAVCLARTDWFVDSSIYYRAGIAVRERTDLYTRILEMRDQGLTIDGPNGIPANRGEPRIFPDYPYIYPPAFAFAYVPLTFVPLAAANLLWLAIGFASLIGSLYLIAGWFYPRPARRRWALALIGSAVSVTLQPVRNTLYIGNTDCLLLLLTTLSLTAFRREQQTRSGLWLALAATIKPALGFVAVYFLWKRGYRAAVVSGATAAVLLVAPFLIVGFDALPKYRDAVAYWTSPLPAAGMVNQSPYGLLLRLFTENGLTRPIVDAPLLAGIGRWLIVGGLLLMLALVIRRRRAESPVGAALESGTVIAALLLISPHTEPIHLTLLVIPLAAVAAAVGGPPLTAGRLLTGGALAALAGFLVLPVRVRTLFLLDGASEPLTYPAALLANTDLLALCAATALVVITLWRYRPGPAADEEGAEVEVSISRLSVYASRHRAPVDRLSA